MQQYLALLQDILDNGTDKSDRTGTGTRSVFGRQIRFDLSKGFPLMTTKKLHFKSVVHELLWFLKGDTNVGYLQRNGVRIWDEWASPEGELGPVYGHQWRSWEGPNGETLDQISWLVNRIKTNPDCRRLIVTAWNPIDLPKMALAPCHCLFQFNTRPMTVQQRLDCQSALGGKFSGKSESEAHALLDLFEVPRFYLDCQLYQRSADVFLGVPFNIASYALLTQMIAHVTGCLPGEFVHTFGDVHIYSNHHEQVRLQLERTPRSLPTVELNPGVKSIFDFKYEDIRLLNYTAESAIKAAVAV